MSKTLEKIQRLILSGEIRISARGVDKVRLFAPSSTKTSCLMTGKLPPRSGYRAQYRISYHPPKWRMTARKDAPYPPYAGYRHAAAYDVRIHYEPADGRIKYLEFVRKP